MPRPFARAGVSLIALALAAPAALSQEDGALVQNEIVVTVQKREQTVQDVPVNVTAYSQETLEQLGVEQFDELAVFVPGLQVQEQSPNNPGFVIRGITSDSGEATQEPRVALFQDGVSIAKSRGSYVELFDIERIEAVKGPQATLFGRGALIGAVSVIQNKADVSDSLFRGKIAAGNYDFFQLDGVANLPLIEDRLAVRVAGVTKEREGFVENTLGGAALNGLGVEAYRLSLGWEPAPDWRVDLIYNHQEDEFPGTAFKSGTFAPPGGTTSPYSPGAFNTFGGIVGGRPLGLQRTVESWTALIDWDINEAMSISAITGWRDFDSSEVFDPDGTALPLFAFAENAYGEQVSQEIRFNHVINDQWSYFAGVSFFSEDGRQEVPLAFDERIVLARIANAITVPAPQPTALLQNPAFTAAILGAFGLGPLAGPVAAQLKPVHLETFTNFGETEAIDLYGDVTFAPNDRWEFAAGLRWTQDDKTSAIQATLPNGGSVLSAVLSGNPAAIGAVLDPTQAPLPIGLFVQPTPGFAKVSRSETFDDLTWRLAARFSLSDSVNLFANYSRGRRPEVLSAAAPGNFSIIPAETVDSFEVGAKGVFLGGNLALDGSVFHYRYENFQTTEFQGAQIVTINAGEAEATGFEVQGDWTPMAGLNVLGTYAFNNAELTTGAREGNKFRLSPEHSLSLALDWTMQAFGGEVFVRPSYTWQSEIFFDDDNDDPALQVRSPAQFSDFAVDDTQVAYGLLNLRVGVDFEAGYRVEAFFNNILDEEYLIDAGNTGDIFGIPTFIRGAPFTFGLSLAADF